MRIQALFLFLLGSVTSIVAGATGDLDGDFMSTVGRGFSKPINAVAVHPDGSILAGGNLGQFQDVNDGVLWRLNADGSLQAVMGPFVDSAGYPEIDVIRVLPDGKILVGGVFSSVNGSAYGGLVRLNADGTVDTDFAFSHISGTLRYIHDIEIQSDGKLIISGAFTGVNGTFRMSVARLLADGSLDPSFAPPTFHTKTDYGTYTGSVDDVDLQPDGRVVLAGSFNLIDSNVVQSGAARLLANGAFDFSFNPGNGAEYRLNRCKVMPDGGILFGGLAGDYQDTPVQGLFKVDANGTLDPAFGANLGVIDGWLGGEIVLQPDGKILACGIFNEVAGDDVSSIVRLNQDGTRDLSFDPTPYTTVRGEYGTHMYAIAQQPDGKIVAGGWMNDDDGIAGTGLGIQINGTKIYNIVRFEGDYTAGPGNLAFTTPTFLTAESDGAAIISVTRYGGVTGAVTVDYSTSDGSALEASDYSNTVGTLTWADGEGGVKTFSIPLIDDDLNEGEEELFLALSGVTGGATLATPSGVLAVLDDDALPVILGGPFDTTIIQGNSDILVVAAWSVLPMTYQWRKDGEDIGWTYPWFLLNTVDAEDAGDYEVIVSNANGSVTSATATVTIEVPPGSLDPSFISRSPSGSIVAHASDGAGGWYVATISGVYHLFADGALDTGFTSPTISNNGGTAFIWALAASGDGTVLVGGSFNTVNGGTVYRLVRLLSDGSIDPSFTPPFDSTSRQINKLTIDGMGNIIASFFSGGGVVKMDANGTLDAHFATDGTIAAGTNGSVGALLAQPDGKLLVAHTQQKGISTYYYRLSRLNVDGSIDVTFTEPLLSWTAHALDLLPDGRIIVGGRFLTVNGVARVRLAILQPDGSLDTSFDPGSGLNNNVWAVRFHAGRILVGGEFTLAVGVDLNRIASFYLDGALDPDFNPGVGLSGKLEEILIDAEGRPVIAGSFNTYNGITTPGIARLVAGPSTVGLLAGSVTAFETDDTVTIEVARFGDSSEALSINWTTVDGTATDPGDYTADSGTLTWAAGEAGAQSIEITLIDDDTLDGDLEFSVTLGTPSTGSVFSDTATILIKDEDSLPQITTQPSPIQAVVGFGAELSVVATSPDDLTYQWYFNGAAIDGETNASLTLSSVDEADEGSYSVRVANGYGSVWSVAVSLYLIPDPSLLVDGFSSAVSFNSTILAMAVTPDGGAYVGGQFTDVGGDSTMDYLAKLNADGTLDTSFTPPSLNSTVYDIALQPDGKILVAGAFWLVNGVSQRGLVRLESDGSVDTEFATNMGAGSNGNVRAVDVFSDGKIVIGGTVSSWKGSSLSPYQDLIRLNADGSYDSVYYKTSGTATILDVMTLPDGSVLASHDTTSSSAAKVTRFKADRITDNTFTYGPGRKKVERIGLASDGDYLFAGVESLKVNPDGTTDTMYSTFSSGQDIVEQLNGKVFLGGSLSGYLKRFLANGSEDPTFAPSPTFNGWIYRLGLSLDGKVWVAGQFTSYLGSSVNRVVLLNGDAIPLAITAHPTSVIADPGDPVAFSMGATGITAIAYQWYRDGIALSDVGNISGAQTATLSFSSVSDSDGGNFTCTITNEAGSLTSKAAHLLVLGAPEFLALSEELTQLAGGSFALTAEAVGAGELSYQWRRNGVPLDDGGAIAGATTATLSLSPAGLSASGTYTLAVTNSLGTTVSSEIVVTIEPNAAALADGFVPLASAGAIYAIQPLPDGRALVGGTVGPLSDGVNSSGKYLAVIKPDGSIDTSVTLEANGNVRAIRLDADGKYVLSGNFSMINGTTRSKVARLNADLTLDETFDPGAGAYVGFGEVFDVAFDAAGNVYLAGSFLGWNAVEGTANFVRLGNDGTLDESYLPAINSYCYRVVPGPEGDMYVTGAFATVGGVAAAYIVRLNSDGTRDEGFASNLGGYAGDELLVLTDGRVMAADQYSRIFARFETDGALDGTWTTSRFDGRVLTSALDGAGRLLVGGKFFQFDGASAGRIVRLLPDDSPDPGFDAGTGFDNDVEAIAIASDGSIWVGGVFTSYNGVPTPGLIRLAGESGLAPEGTTYAAYAAELTFPDGLAGPYDDANGNDMPNLLDFLRGLDPLDPDSSLDRHPDFATGESLGLMGDTDLYLVFALSVRADAVGLEWGVEMSQNLGFDETAAPAVVVGEPVEADGMLTYTFRSPWSVSSTRAIFYHLWGEVTP